MVFRPCLKQNADESMIAKRKKNKKKPAQLDGIDLVEWFLAIDGCLS
jgi:hypothetical protein